MSLLRLPINVKLYKNGEVVQRVNSSKKSQIISRVGAFERETWDKGFLKVWYSREQDFWNANDFYSLNQLQGLLTINTEPNLIKHLKGIIPQKYLQKKKQTPAQRASFERMRKKSPLKLKRKRG